MNIFNLRPYYNVPPCPVCGSEITGRYIRQAANDATSQKIIRDGLKNGEIIKISQGYNRDMCFCLSCEQEWCEYVPLILVPKERISEERQKRHVQTIEAAYELQKSEEEPQKKRHFFFG